MDSYDGYLLARALHVIGVVLWIGGVAFVTTVLIPALRRMDSTAGRLQLFERLESSFGHQARVVTLVTALSGAYMLEYLDAWGRYLSLEYWWLHLMTFIWAVFTLVLFVLEPLWLHRLFHRLAEGDSDHAFALLHRMHKVLLGLSLLAVFAAVAGAHGYRIGL